MNNSNFKYKIFRLTISQYSLLLKLVGKLSRKSKYFYLLFYFVIPHKVQAQAGLGYNKLDISWI